MSGAAAKLERTGFVLRNALPGFKHWGLEQSVQSANESGFVRKNSRKVEAAASSSSHCPRPASLSLRTGAPAAAAPPTAAQRASRRLAPEALGNAALRPRSRQLSTVGACAEPKPLQPALAALLPDRRPAPEVPPPREEPKTRGGASIEELIRTASEKYELNKDFWGKYNDIPSMAQASEKADILQIIENFVIIHRKHVYLFQRLKNTVLKTLDNWSAPDLAALCHAWVQLGFLHEDLCVAMARRVTATAHACNATELCWLMDAYASARCSVHSVVEELTKQTLRKLEDFTPSQLCLHASSFARLNVQHNLLFECIAKRLAISLPLREPPGLEKEIVEGAEQQNASVLSARDITLAAYSFGKLGYHSPSIFQAISKGAAGVIRDFTARDLQMLLVALAKAQHRDDELLTALTLQANRRVAQFSAESLALTLRSLAFFNHRDDALFTRALVQLPRTILHSKPADVTTLLNAFAAVQIHSAALMDVVTPFLMEKAPFLTPADWLSALRGYSVLGHRDDAFLSTLRLHLVASKLTSSQLCSALVDCSRLSFSGLSPALIEAAVAKVAPDSPALPADHAAQMYSALLLLGHSAPSEPEPTRALLEELSGQLHRRQAAGELSPTACATLCYAMLLAPPVVQAAGGAPRHPLDASALLEKCVMEAHALSAEDRLVLRLVCSALKLLPWNRRALESVRRLEPLTASAPVPTAEEPLAPYFLSALAHLAPQSSPGTWPAKEPRPVQSSAEADGSWPAAGGSFFQGVFVAKEVEEGLEELRSLLSAKGVLHELNVDLGTEAHISLGPAALASLLGVNARRGVAILWGSTVHYIHGASPEQLAKAEPRLSPVSKFQVALLQELRDVDVVVVPHWRWQRSAPLEERAQLLTSLLREPAGC